MVLHVLRFYPMIEQLCLLIYHGNFYRYRYLQLYCLQPHRFSAAALLGDEVALVVFLYSSMLKQDHLVYALIDNETTYLVLD